MFQLITAGAAILVLLILGGTAASMAWGGRLAFQTFGWRFITIRPGMRLAAHFGALVPIYGTLVTSAIALIIAVPVSIGIALFLTDIAPRWTRGPIAIAIELLAAIPSIIYGMWGLFVFAPFMAAHVEPWLSDHLGRQGHRWAAVQRPADRNWHAHRGDRPRDHGYPVHRRRSRARCSAQFPRHFANQRWRLGPPAGKSSAA